MSSTPASIGDESTASWDSPIRAAALLAAGATAGIASLFIANRLTSAAKPTMRHTQPPQLAAGKIDDLAMAYQSWRDIRPYHLNGCACALCDPQDASPQVASPMAARSDGLHKYVPKGPQLSSDFKEAQTPPSAFGFRPYTAMPGKPFKVYAGFHMTRQARLWCSKSIDDVIALGGTRPVGVPSSKTPVDFDTIFNIIKDLGAKVYVYGGVLRDVIVKGPHVADDIDVLFTCSVQQMVGAFEALGWSEGVDFHLKRDESTGAVRYDYISVGKGKAKFSGHTLDSNCAGEFAFNCMLYDVQKKILIDSSGWGVQDAAFGFLRIPYDGGNISDDGKTQWEMWRCVCVCCCCCLLCC